MIIPPGYISARAFFLVSQVVYIPEARQWSIQYHQQYFSQDEDHRNGN